MYNLQEPHFWTLCTDVYIGTLKLLVAPEADARWILSQTHHIFTQVPEHTTPPFVSLNAPQQILRRWSLKAPGLTFFRQVPEGNMCLSLYRRGSDSCTSRLKQLPCRRPAPSTPGTNQLQCEGDCHWREWEG